MYPREGRHLWRWRTTPLEVPEVRSYPRYSYHMLWVQKPRQAAKQAPVQGAKQTPQGATDAHGRQDTHKTPKGRQGANSGGGSRHPRQVTRGDPQASNSGDTQGKARHGTRGGNQTQASTHGDACGAKERQTSQPTPRETPKPTPVGSHVDEHLNAAKAPTETSEWDEGLN